MEKNGIILISVFLAVGLIAGIFLSESLTGNALFNFKKNQPVAQEGGSTKCLINANQLKLSTEYIIADTVKDLYRSSEDTYPIHSNARVLRLKASGRNDQGIIAGMQDTEEVYIALYSSGSNGLALYIKEQGGSRAIFVQAVNLSTTRSSPLYLSLDYGSRVYNLYASKSQNSEGQEWMSAELLISAGSDSYLKIYFESSRNGEITYVGHSETDTNTENDIIYNMDWVITDISNYNKNTLLPLGGILVINPRINNPSDQIKFKVDDGTYGTPRPLNLI